MTGIARRALVLTMLLAACGGSGTHTERPAPATPPRMISNLRLDLELPPTRSASTGTVAQLDIRVMVDSTGHAIPSTLKVVGVGARENEDAIRRWLVSSRFEPGRRNGQPVAAEFQYSRRAEVRTRRVSP